MKILKTAFYLFLTTVLFHACRKEYSLEGGGLKVPSGTWEFMDSLAQFQGNMDTAYISSSPGTSTKELQLLGTSLDGSQSFHMHLFADSFKTGTYKASLFQSSFEYTMPAKTVYQADQLIGEFIVTITSFGNNFVSGTFSGAAIDSTNKIKNLSQGKFTSIIALGSTTPSTGVLGDSSGNCKPVTLAGVYTKGIALTSANTAQIQVVVAVAGSYSITTNTVNGVTFSKAGTFTSTGVQTVTLNGVSTPVNSGDQIFTVSYGNSQCAFKINFGTPAAGILGGGGGNCTPFTPAGLYRQGLALTSSNTVALQVNVTSPGSYTISSNAVNGVSFTGSGTFTTTGVQTIFLTGSGVPVNSGLQNFAVTFGTSVCNFSITFEVNAMPSNDYFPLSVNSNWPYSLDGGTSSDSVYSVVISYSPTIGGTTYKTIALHDVPFAGPAVDSFYYRKPGGDYYQYLNYSSHFLFDGVVAGEYIFLKDNVAAGTTWVSPTVSGTISGVPFSGFIQMTLLEKAVPASVGAFNFPDVIKVKYEYFITGSPVAIETDERWFAKNQGEIYDSFSNGVSTEIYEVGNYQVF